MCEDLVSFHQSLRLNGSAVYYSQSAYARSLEKLPLLLVVLYSVKDLVRDYIGLLLRNKGLLGSTGLSYIMKYAEPLLEIAR